MSTLTLQATHVGAGFLRHLRAEFGVDLVGMGVIKSAHTFVFEGTSEELRAVQRQYFTEESYDLVEEPCY